MIWKLIDGNDRVTRADVERGVIAAASRRFVERSMSVHSVASGPEDPDHSILVFDPDGGRASGRKQAILR